MGKTILACALANQACRQNRSVAYVRVPDLVLSLDAGRGGTNYIRLMRRLTTVDLLILDLCEAFTHVEFIPPIGD